MNSIASNNGNGNFDSNYQLPLERSVMPLQSNQGRPKNSSRDFKRQKRGELNNPINTQKMYEHKQFASQWLGVNATDEEILKLARAIAYGEAIGVSAPVAIHTIEVSEKMVTISPSVLNGLLMSQDDLDEMKFFEEEDHISVKIKRNGFTFVGNFHLSEAHQLNCLARQTWKSNQKQMVKDRALFRAARAAYPEIVLTAISPDEALDFAVKQPEQHRSWLAKAKALLIKLLSK